MPSAAGLADRVVQAGRDAGLDAVGFAPATPFHETLTHLRQRKADGLHGGMEFTYRSPERSTDPGQILADAATLVVAALSYRRGPAPARPHPLSARVAAYAWEDHYKALREGLAAMAGVLVAAGHRARVVADDNALVDREAAHRAGLGWYGKNTNLLLPGRGSWFVLGSVVTDATLPASAPVADGCGSCRRCLPACPTGAIVAPGIIDARRCLAWLVQADGVFPLQQRVALGDRIYGCDDCQEVCPVNRVQEPGPAPAHEATAWADLTFLLSADDAELLARHGRWYIPRRDPRYLRRNALIVLGNLAATLAPAQETAVRAEVEGLLVRWLASPDPLLRAHAVWAAGRAGRPDLCDQLRADPDPLVRSELATLPDRTPTLGGPCPTSW